MAKIVECVPNFSEGRNKEVLDSIASELTSVDGVKLLDREGDPDHNRSVMTIIGSPEAVSEAAFRACKKAAELIDMDNHSGEHKRMGATDVIPFIPISEVTMDECIGLAKSLGERIGDELEIPVYLYAAAATKPERVRLPTVRKGEYEGIKEEIGTNPERDPDFGPAKMPKAGATAVGAREILVAYNVNLTTDNLDLAKEIGKSIRESSGGYKHVQAMGIGIASGAEVTMNLLNYKETPAYIVFDKIEEMANAQGVGILNSEFVGMVPKQLFIDAGKHYLDKDAPEDELIDSAIEHFKCKETGFDKQKQILENNL